MLLKDLRKVIQEGKPVDITGVKLQPDDVWSTTNQLSSVLHIRFNLPSVENKPINDSLDIAEVRLSTKPKYDPCRRLRKGDIVEPRELYGRKHKALDYDYRYEVLKDEDENGIVKVEYFDGSFTCTSYIPFYWFELVIPVEEMEPFNIYKSDDNEYVILFEDTRVSTFPFKGDGYPYYYTQEQAKAAAEAERDRLNAKWRKEHE